MLISRKSIYETIFSRFEKVHKYKGHESFSGFVKEVKQEDGKVKIKGFASTPDLDRYDDIVQPTAFAEAMSTYMKNPVVLLGHDTDKPIGTVTEYNLGTK